MRRFIGMCLTLSIFTTTLSNCASPPATLSDPGAAATPTFANATSATETIDPLTESFSHISQESLFGFLDDLTSIQPYSGWRNSASQGEAEALDLVAETLGGFTYLQSLGLELERQSFHVYLASEMWESRLFLTLDGQEVEVPTNAISGHRKVLELALRFDSDGKLNDDERNPLSVSGDMLLIRSADEVANLPQDVVQGKIALLDFSVVDPSNTDAGGGPLILTSMIEKGVAALVLVTEDGKAKNAGDGTILETHAPTRTIPTLYVRLEDLAARGIDSWEQLAQIEAARLVWDTDVFSPGQSGNLVARIPGMDPSRAIILGAHIDSANSPGAGDNGLNCAVLLETARVLDEWKVQPPVDLYLVWLGSHELGFYGSQHFVVTHQELLDRSLAAFLMDGFTADNPGPTIFGMQEASYARFGETQTPLAAYLAQKAEAYQIPIDLFAGSNIFSSDEGPFFGFVPSVRFAFGNNHIGKRFHSPYDALESVQDQGEVMEQTVMMALIAALGTPQDAPDLRLTPEPERRALIIATHTEVLHMNPTMLLDLNHALAWEGLDVDVIPYGQSFTADDLTNVDLVIVLPVIDYPRADDDSALYDEQWAVEEVQRLVGYVEEGGLLVLTNSARRLFFGDLSDMNEDWDDVNTLAAPFGVSYEGEPFLRSRALISEDHPLTKNLSSLYLLSNNGMPFRMQAGQTLAEIDGQATLGLVDFGGYGGQVLVLSDLGIFDPYDFGQRERNNFIFMRNLASYARER